MVGFKPVIVAVLAAGAASPCAAQGSPAGKTLIGQVRICLPSSQRCLPPVKVQVYVSNQGRVFDYSGSSQGRVSPIGKAVTEGDVRTRYAMRGNVLTMERTDANLELRATVRVTGSSCDLNYDGRIIATGEKPTFEILSCRVVDGNQPY